MRNQLLWRAGRAAEDLLSACGFCCEKAAENPNKRKQFDEIVARISNELAEATSDLDAGFAERLLSALDIDYEEITAGELGTALARAAALLPDPARYVKRVVPVFAAELEGLVLASRSTALRGTKGAGPLLSEDQEVLNALRDSQAYFIRQAIQGRNDALEARIRVIIDRAINGGWRRKDVAVALEEAIGPAATVARQEHYYDVLAGAFVGHARTFGVLTRFRDSEITRYVWESVLDEVTSDVCRFLHGMVFTVQGGLDVYRRMASNVDGARDAAPWVRVGRNEAGQKVLYTKALGHRTEIATVLRSGVGYRDDVGEYASNYDAPRLESVGICLPPAHGNCRSTVIADV